MQNNNLVSLLILSRAMIGWSSDSYSDHTESWDKEHYVWGVKMLILYSRLKLGLRQQLTIYKL